MTNVIGLRFYRVTLHEEGQSPTFANDDPKMFKGEKHLLSEFVQKHTKVTTVDDAQRGWFFNKPTDLSKKTISGRITYGIHGITSRFVDLVGRDERFKREANHLEEIPLYFRFYRPEGEHYMIFAFQSYGIRSCVSLVQQSFKEYVKNQSSLIVRYKKLMPADAGVEPFADGYVKHMTFLKRKVSSDEVDAYRDDAPTEYDVEVSLKARGKANFGRYKEMSKEKLKKAGHTIALIDDFDKGTVKVSLDGSSKNITVFGDQGEVGTIDVSDDKKLKLEDGHPTVESLDTISKSIVKQFNNALTGFKK